jgi:glycosyltransferase involved in cell wall biosynthesis
VITLNEELNIAAALDSLSWADEIVVVDSESTDSTVEIASRYTNRIFIRSWPGYAAQKTFATEQASNDWIFNLDADERVSPELAAEIQHLKQADEPGAAGFEMPRKTFYLGRWIRHAGWYPDYKLRLYDRRKGGWRGDFVHESVAVEGLVQRLAGELLHYTVRNSSEHHLRLDRYTTLAAREMRSKGKTASLWSLVGAPAAAFIKSYFLKLGCLDGIPGLAIARFAAQYVFIRNLKLWEMNSGSDKNAGPNRDR